MRVRDVMSKPYLIDKSSRISEALDMIDKYHVRRLVVKHRDNVLGIITLRSICRELGSRRKYNHPPSTFHVCDALSNSYGIVEPDDELEKAIDMLKTLDSVLVKDGTITGAVTTKDIIKHITPSGDVAAIMNMPVIAPPDSRVAFIRKLMMDKNVSRVPIIDGSVLVGLVSETDIAKAFRGLKRRAPQSQQDNKVETMIATDIMTMGVITTTPKMPIKEAAALMIEKDIGALPVLNENRHLIGMVTRRDIIRAI